MKARALLGLLGTGLLGAAVAAELRKPRGERAWHGKVARVVPYDLRPPTPQRIRDRWWNPEDERLFTGQVFGVGWSVNVGRLARIVGLA